jgi:hypothetical protein
MDIKIKEEIVEILIKKFETLIKDCEEYQYIKKDDSIKIRNMMIYSTGKTCSIYYREESFEIDEKEFLRLEKLATDKRIELFLKEIKR